jgi:transcriptional regulator with XRE-family HTH domain
MALRSNARLARAIGARIRLLRDEVGLTQEKLAWECDLTKGYLSQVEAGKRTASIPALAALAGRLGVLVADLVAADLSEPRLALLEAARRRDSKGVELAVRKLGLAASGRK